MSEVEVIKLLVNQRLTAVAEEIVGLFEKTFAEYRDNVARLVEETERQRRLLESVKTPGAPSPHTESQPALEIDTAPKQQTLGVSLNHEHIGARYIKEEQEEMWSSHEGEQLQGVETFSFGFIPLKTESREESEVSSPYLVKLLRGDYQPQQKCNEEVPSQEHEWRPALKEEPECSQTEVEQEELRRSQRETRIGLGENSVTELPFIAVKREADEEEALSAQLHNNAESSDCQSTEHMQVESDGDDSGGAEPLTEAASDKTSDSSDSETEDSDDDWKRINTKQSHFKVMIGNRVANSQPVQTLDPTSVSDEKTSDSSETETEDSDNDLMDSDKSKKGSTSVTFKHALVASSSKMHTEKKSNCRQQLNNHTGTQTAQISIQGSQLVLHKANSGMRTSSTERLLSDSKKREESASPKAQNTKDKCFTCSSCNKSFQRKTHLIQHMKMHKENPNISGVNKPV
ncbi:lisH domain-containing protein C1711.05-like isoform X2 [Astatotilapia calliptera]|uniref:lisH domain-containing protein C1711.05-like isoform X2 n=1 Tax=Astatotilapia calliptera TaxID=8154 RepID=UPI000E40F22E|nr:lisH domain-containing protein C1711.05-like isoform X2 [Astatotilapia calliptera]